MPDNVATPTNDIDEVLADVLAVETYISMAIACYEVPATTTFDPYLGLTTLQLAVIQLHAAAVGTDVPTPMVAVPADSAEHALQLARAQLVATGEHVVDLIRAEHTTTPNRCLLTDTLRLLNDAHQELFGQRW